MQAQKTLPRELVPGLFWLGDCLEQKTAGKIYHTYNAAYLLVGTNALVPVRVLGFIFWVSLAHTVLLGLPAMLALRQWGEKWELPAPANPVLCDARDGQPIAQIDIRSHDGRPLSPVDLVWRDRSELDDATTAAQDRLRQG